MVSTYQADPSCFYLLSVLNIMQTQVCELLHSLCDWLTISTLEKMKYIGFCLRTILDFFLYLVEKELDVQSR